MFAGGVGLYALTHWALKSPVMMRRASRLKVQFNFRLTLNDGIAPTEIFALRGNPICLFNIRELYAVAAVVDPPAI